MDGTLTTERLQGFFDGLAAMLATAQDGQSAEEEEHRTRLRAFFVGLAPVVAVATEAQKVLDRMVATQFSVFHYFGKNENRLEEARVSGIFADLLRPDGRHGQGTAFLGLFLEEIDRGDKACIRKRRAYSSLERCSVYAEYPTLAGRRIDIALNLEGMWIGIENKPWAPERCNQLQDYLTFLQQKDAKACMLYLSGDGDDAETIEDDDHYLTIPYGYMHDGPSIAHWIAACQRRCEADKVRWFLKDLLEYIVRMFYSEQLEEPR